MKNNKLFFVLLLCVLIAFFGCTTKSDSYPGKNGAVLEILHSKCVVKGLLNETSEQVINVYLPPSYHENLEKSYPVVYFLHGFSGAPNIITSRNYILNRIFSEQEAIEMIIVEPNGNSLLGGSFFWNSPVSGMWEDYIVKEVIPMIDEKYRTIKNRQSRGIGGFSMGGTGALNIALAHPDLFNAVYAFSPGLLAEGDLDLQIESWDNNQSFFNSYGAAASPNKTLSEPYAEIPYVTYSDEIENNRVIENWYTVFGNINEKVELYQQKNKPIEGIRFRVGKEDFFEWIPRGCVVLDNILSKNGISHEFLYEEGGHSLPVSHIENYIVPFYSEYLMFE